MVDQARRLHHHVLAVVYDKQRVPGPEVGGDEAVDVGDVARRVLFVGGV
jgi:hypothetical protein